MIIGSLLLPHLSVCQVPSKQEAKEYKSFNPWGLSVKEQIRLLDKKRGKDFITIGTKKYLFITAVGKGDTRAEAREASFIWCIGGVVDAIGPMLYSSIEEENSGRQLVTIRSSIDGAESSISSSLKTEGGVSNRILSSRQSVLYRLDMVRSIRDGKKQQDFDRRGFPMHLVEKVVHLYAYDDNSNQFKSICGLAVDADLLQLFAEGLESEPELNLIETESSDDDLGDWDK